MPEPTTHDLEKLIRGAIQVRDQAYAPHSRFHVGAALMTADGRIFAGCNVENASYSLTICAERVAASAAVAAGYRSWPVIAIASTGGVTPCGACRQFLSEFGTDVAVVLVDVTNESHRQCKLSQLLPDAFDGSSLPSDA